MISSRGRDLAIWLGIFTALTLLSVCFRFAAMRKLQRPARADDYLVITAMVSMLALEGCTFWGL